MKNKLLLIFFALIVFSLTLSAADNELIKVKDATPLFLWSIIIGGVALATTAILGAFAQSKAIRTAADNIGRNPAAADSIKTILIIGLALIESLVIYVLLIDLIIFFVKWGNYSY